MAKDLSYLFSSSIYTVSKLTDEIAQIIEGTYPNILVEGEISNLKLSHKGHLYFTLKDEKAKIKAVIFRGEREFIPFELSSGLFVICRARVSVYKPRGEYQLIVSDVIPKGKGALQLAFEQLKEKLKKEGLFDEDKKLPIPSFPKRLGIVTSPYGAAIRDILNVLKRRFYNLEVLIYPVRVQGKEASFDICRGIEFLNCKGDIDVIILARGGGSIEDLWPFNEEIVARAIYKSKIPIISAIGHETDYTISDFVADLRAPTPSAAAELVVSKKDELKRRIYEAKERISFSFLKIWKEKSERLSYLKDRIQANSPKRKIRLSLERISDMRKRIENRMNTLISIKEQDFLNLAKRLDNLSPLNILAKGYTITKKDGKIIKDVKDLAVGDLICTSFRKGETQSKIIEIRDV